VIFEFVEAAKKLKVFTRDALVKSLVPKHEEELMLRYFWYCSGREIIVPA
jgi:hypothetical protein